MSSRPVPTATRPSSADIPSDEPPKQGPLFPACERNEHGYLWNFDGAIAEKYPVSMTPLFSGDTLEGKVRRLTGPKDLLALYDGVFTLKSVGAILESTPRYMFVRDQGAMLGSSWVWFGADGKATALNNF